MGEMELILWRHAEAVDGVPDDERALTEKGRRQAERMAHFLTGRLPKNTRVLVSPALRAQQTASALTRRFTTDPAIGTRASAQSALAASGWPSANDPALLVGHQPWLGELAALLMTGKAHPWSMKKGAIWWFSRREDEDQTLLRLVIAPDQL
jgi:phosphohistidine phosphatase